jgi:hypothetical protein
MGKSGRIRRRQRCYVEAINALFSLLELGFSLGPASKPADGAVVFRTEAFSKPFGLLLSLRDEPRSGHEQCNH